MTRRGQAKPDIGILLLHGFSSTPDSVAAWADHLRRQRFLVSTPVLPGHATSWQNLAKVRRTDWRQAVETAYADLRRHCRTVACGGLSMGATLCLDLATRHPDIHSLCLVNPALLFQDRRILLTPLLKHIIPSSHGVGSDLHDPSARETAYDRIPTAAVAELLKLSREVLRNLPKVTTPLTVFVSPQDHVIRPASAFLVINRVASADRRLVLLPRSYHVATMDYDKETVFRLSAERFRG